MLLPSYPRRLGYGGLFENVLCFGRPSVSARIGIVLFNVVGDSVNEVWLALEHAAADAFVRDLAKPAFDQVEPRGTGRREVDMKTQMLPEPFLDVGMFVGGVVVHDQMQIQL